MKVIALAVVGLLAVSKSGIAATLTASECANLAIQVDRGPPSGVASILPNLIRDGDPEVAAAAQRLAALHAATPPRAALVNATQDLRYQLQVCARR